MTEGTKAAGKTRLKAETKKAVLGNKKASKPGNEGSTGADKSRRSSDKKDKSLGQEAFSVMGSRRSKIIEQLLGRSMQGDSKSSQFLAKLADKEGVAMEALLHGPLRSQALAWAEEPAWEDEGGPEHVETEAGSGSEEAE